MLRRVVPLMIATLLIVSACTNKAKQGTDSANGAQSAPQTSNQATTPPPAPAGQPDQSAAPQQSTTSQPKAAETETRPPRVVEHQTSAAESKPPTEHVAPKPVVIPAGTEITVRLAQTVDATKNKAGDNFDGTVAKAVISDGKTVIPASSPVSGTVVQAAKAGKLKGEGRLSVKLTHITVQGVPYTISTAAVSRGVSGKGKRSAVMIGGGTGAGALIGGLAGGGKGAAIGAVVGGGAGTAGATLTGNEQISFPAESALTFRLQQPLTLGKHAAAPRNDEAAEDRTQ